MVHKILKYGQNNIKKCFPNLCRLMRIFTILIFIWYIWQFYWLNRGIIYVHCNWLLWAMDLKSVCSSAIWNESLFGWRGWYINLHLIQGFLTLKVTISVSWLFLFIWLTLSLCHLQENIVLEYSMITTPPIGQMKSSLKLSKIINSHRWHNFPEHLQVDELRRKFNTVRRSYSKRE